MISVNVLKVCVISDQCDCDYCECDYCERIHVLSLVHYHALYNDVPIISD